jgi:prevent-host-death family protein
MVAGNEPRKGRIREASASYGRTEVPASDLKNDWHHWLDEVARGRRTLVVTRYGTPIAVLAPFDAAPEAGPVFGALEGWVEAEGDLIAPVGEGWDAEP